MAVTLTTNEGAVIASVLGQFDRSLPKGTFSIGRMGDKLLLQHPAFHTAIILTVETTLDGVTYATLEELANVLSAFNRGGTGPGTTTGVQSLSGSLVTGTAEHPVVNAPTWGQIPDKPEFFTPADHTHVVSDITDLNIDHSPAGSTVVERTATGQGKFYPAIGSDEAVVKSQLDSSTAGFTSELENKVDKVDGESLTPERFTADEKTKLSGLENVHYKGWFTSLASLEAAYPAPEEGSHALVDDVAGSLVYIWKTDVEPPIWEAKVGESTEITAAQVKTYYESNPDTNAFTDAEKTKLSNITSAFTTVLKTSYDNVVTWITNNGQSLLDHLTNYSNPHNVTAEQVGLGDVQTQLEGKADLIDGKIPQEQLPSDTGGSSLVAQVTAISTSQYIIADLPTDAPDLLRFELYIPDTIAPSYISMRFNGLSSSIYKHVLQNVNNASYSMVRNYSQNQIRILSAPNGAVVGRYNIRIEGTINNVAGQIKIANGTGYLAGNSPSTGPDINNFFGSAHDQSITDGKITQLLFVAMNSGGTARIASGSVLNIYGIK